MPHYAERRARRRAKHIQHVYWKERTINTNKLAVFVTVKEAACIIMYVQSLYSYVFGGRDLIR